ncbi:unnamed protein product [Rhodiola kirilowii]
MNWIQRKIYLYNITFGLFMLDPWDGSAIYSMLLFLCRCGLFSTMAQDMQLSSTPDSYDPSYGWILNLKFPFRFK